MSVLVDVYNSQQRNGTTQRPPVQISVRQNLAANTSTTGAKRCPSLGRRIFFVGLILGALLAANAAAVVIVLWQTSGITILSTTASTTMMISTTTMKTATTTTSTMKTTTTTTTTTRTTTTTTTTATIAATTTTVTTITTRTTATTTTTITTITTTTTTTSVTTTTTKTVPPSTICVSNTTFNFQNNEFIYSPTSQSYAAGMLNNQFGVYQANGYLGVTSTALWTAPQSSTSVTCFLSLQTDRNLVVYASGNWTVLWTANIFNNGSGAPFCFQMLDSGNLIWTDNTATTIWQTNTAQAG